MSERALPRASGRMPPGSVRSVNYATSPLLASKTPPWRSRFVVVLVAVAFLALLARALLVQIVDTAFYQAKGEKNYLLRQQLPASRGRIFDRNGVVLATSVALPSVQVDLKAFDADADERRELARLVGLSPRELDQRLDGDSGVVSLRRHLEEPAWEAIKALQLKGVQQLPEYKRRYPEGEAVAPVIGLTDVEDKGLEGLEFRFDEQLHGQSGQRTVMRDRIGRIVDDLGDEQAPVNGNDLTLSIDSRVQFFAWQQVRNAVRLQAARSGTAVVLDTRTGEVLALANFDNPDYQTAQARRLPARNRALTEASEPGSTMKPFVVAQALESGRVTPATVIQTAPGHIMIGNYDIKDTHPHGALTVAEVIQKSSNVGVVRISLQMPARELWELFTGLGFGQRPTIELPGSSGGRLRPYGTWHEVGQASISFGYSLQVSPIQLARAYTAFAHDGEVLPLTIIRRSPEEVATLPGQRLFSARTAGQMRDMLQLVVQPGGTAPKAQALGYSVGGKTGTARRNENGVYTNKYRAWFVGLAPVKQPRIVVAVMIDAPSKGQYVGGDVAAPVFAQIVQQTLRLMNVMPDMDVKVQLAAPVVPAEPENF